MSLGDQLYAPSARDIIALDAAPTRLAVVTSGSGSSTAIAAVGNSIPTDECWVIFGCTAVVTPGAAQFCFSVIFDIIDPVNNAQIARLGNAAGPELGTTVAQQTGCDRQINGMIAMPGEALRASGTFNAGANPNTVQFSFWGIKVPRGNVLK
jgi:hypothetical protein